MTTHDYNPLSFSDDGNGIDCRARYIQINISQRERKRERERRAGKGGRAGGAGARAVIAERQLVRLGFFFFLFFSFPGRWAIKSRQKGNQIKRRKLKCVSDGRTAASQTEQERKREREKRAFPRRREMHARLSRDGSNAPFAVIPSTRRRTRTTTTAEARSLPRIGKNFFFSLCWCLCVPTGTTHLSARYNN